MASFLSNLHEIFFTINLLKPSLKASEYTNDFSSGENYIFHLVHMAFKQIVLILVCIILAVAVAHPLNQSDSNSDKSKYKLLAIELRRKIDFSLEILASETKNGSLDIIPCEPTPWGDIYCKMFCQSQGFNDGYCKNLGDEDLCVCYG